MLVVILAPIVPLKDADLAKGKRLPLLLSHLRTVVTRGQIVQPDSSDNQRGKRVQEGRNGGEAERQ